MPGVSDEQSLPVRRAHTPLLAHGQGTEAQQGGERNMPCQEHLCTRPVASIPRTFRLHGGDRELRPHVQHSHKAEAQAFLQDSDSFQETRTAGADQSSPDISSSTEALDEDPPPIGDSPASGRGGPW